MCPASPPITSLPYPVTLGGITVSLSGVLCPLSYVSKTQVNFVVPTGIPAGRYLLTVNSATTDALVSDVAPGIFTLSGDGSGVPSAALIAVLNDGSSVTMSPYQCTASNCTISPVALPNATASVYVVLYGTGIRNARSITATLGTIAAQVVYFGSVPAYPGLDQVNLLITDPSILKGRQSIVLQADGTPSNSVDLLFQ